MTMPEHRPPIERIYDLNRLSEAGYEITIVPDDLAKIATWTELVSVEHFVGRVSVRRLPANRFAYAATLEARITQSCAVTLEPVASEIALDFARTIHLVAHAKSNFDLAGELNPASGDDDVPEEIDNSRYDLAAPLLEEFLLAIDPYPRAPGVEFEAPRAAEGPAEKENPFAVLEKLKEKRQ